MVQWLGLHAFMAVGQGSIPGHGTKILHAAWHSKFREKRKKERKKRNANGKKEVKLSVLLYIENSKDTTKKLLELISEFGKTAGCKSNAHKSLVVL